MSATTIVPTARSGEAGKIVTAREAVRLIRTGDTIAVGGFGGIGIAEEVVHELGEIYKASDAEAANFGSSPAHEEPWRGRHDLCQSRW
jgi:propionate CoA-transferase